MGILGTGYRSSFLHSPAQVILQPADTASCTPVGRPTHGSLARAFLWACLALASLGFFAAPANAGVVFQELPQGHGGTGKSFEVRFFINPSPSPALTPGDIRVTNGTVTHVGGVGNSMFAHRMVIQPSSNMDVTFRIPSARKQVVKGPAGDARVKNMWMQDVRESERDIYLDFYHPKRWYYLGRRAFGVRLNVQTHTSGTRICIYSDDESAPRNCRTGSTMSVVLDRDRDRPNSAHMWTVRITSEDGSGVTAYHVVVGDGPLTHPSYLDCTDDMFESVEVTPTGAGSMKSVEERGCRRLVVTVAGQGNRIEDHRIRGDIVEVVAPLKANYPGAEVFLDWSDFYDGKSYTQTLDNARPELRLDETILQLRVRLPHGTVNRRSVTRTSGNRTYEHLVYYIKVVREVGGSGSGTGKSSAPLTATFEDAPGSHDGSPFTFRIAFSDDVDITPEEMRDHALTVREGTVTDAVRVDSRDDLWEFTVEPTGTEAISVFAESGRACTEEGALCTSDGRRLSSGLSKKVFPYANATETWQAPESTLPGLTIEDARIQEARKARLVFRITLSEASSQPVTFQIGTSNGSAIAGQDYVARSKTKTFAPGKTSGVFKVRVRDDDHDEGEETLTVTISNASGARIVDGTATGTIVNSDGMPQDWLARFGRTVAEQVIEAVETRLSDARSPGARLQVGGQTLDVDALKASDERLKEAEAVEQDEARDQLLVIGQWLEQSGAGRTHDFGEPQVPLDAYPGGPVSLASRDLLTGTSFNLTSEAGAGALISLWGRGDISRFDGRTDAISVDGEVETLMLGADWSRNAWTTGVLLSHSRGDGDWIGAGEGRVESTLSGIWPYGRYQYGKRLSLWGIAGYGEGEMDLKPEGVTPMETDMDLVMGALGVHGVLLQAPESGGLELAMISDALAVRTSSDRTAGLASSEADVTRVRLGLEGTWLGLEAGAGTWVPRIEVGIRHDDGDAETGFGAEVGTGLSFRHATHGITAELWARTLIAHEESGFENYGLSGSLAWDPKPASHHGPSLTLSQTLGVSDSGSMEALLGRATMAGLYTEELGREADSRQLELRAGYGFGIRGGQWILTPELGLGRSTQQREYQLGTRLDRAGRGPGSTQLAFELRRQEPLDGLGDTEHVIGLQLHLRF